MSARIDGRESPNYNDASARFIRRFGERNGANLKEVAGMLGHSTPEPTARVYWHLKEAKAQHGMMAKHNPVLKLIAKNKRAQEG